MEILVSKKPITPGQRHTCLLSKKHLTKKKNFKKPKLFFKE